VSPPVHAEIVPFFCVNMKSLMAVPRFKTRTLGWRDHPVGAQDSNMPLGGATVNERSKIRFGHTAL